MTEKEGNTRRRGRLNESQKFFEASATRDYHYMLDKAHAMACRKQREANMPLIEVVPWLRLEYQRAWETYVDTLSEFGIDINSLSR